MFFSWCPQSHVELCSNNTRNAYSRVYAYWYLKLIVLFELYCCCQDPAGAGHGSSCYNCCHDPAYVVATIQLLLPGVLITQSKLFMTNADYLLIAPQPYVYTRCFASRAAYAARYTRSGRKSTSNYAKRTEGLWLDIIYIYIYEYIYIIYKVPLWKVPRGVAQERTNARIKYLRTYLFRTNYLLRTNCTHPSCKEHTHTYFWGKTT